MGFACGVAIYLGADRVKDMASSAFGWARFQIVGTQVTGSGTLRRMGFCYGGVRINCVVDGDTIWVGGEKIRLQSIDARKSMANVPTRKTSHRAPSIG